jgi:acyl-CoA thioesterase FadM
MPVEQFIRDPSPYDIKDKDDIEDEEVSKDPGGGFWYPTVLLNMDFKKPLPEEGVEWLFVRSDAKQIKNGRMDIEIVILDEGGEIVALSHHIALAVDSSRNFADRKTGSKI